MIPSFSAGCTTEREQIVKRPLRKPGKFWKKHGRHFFQKGEFYSTATVHTLLCDTFLSLCCFRLEVLRTRRRKVFKLEQGNGGWGDIRDHRLCLNISVHRQNWRKKPLWQRGEEKNWGTVIGETSDLTNSASISLRIDRIEELSGNICAMQCAQRNEQKTNIFLKKGKIQQMSF